MDVLLTNVRIASMRGDTDAAYGELDADAIGFSDGCVGWIGRGAEIASGRAPATRLDCAGRWLTPGLIDCHTHLVYAGNRAREFELRLSGATYEDIARTGGGINATVTATRAASEDELIAQALPRLRALVAEGVTTIEIKSGYGLDLESERKMLRVARALGSLVPVTVRTSLLALHAVPPEFVGRADAYVAFACDELIPAAAREGLADAVDGFCEGIGFTAAQIDRAFATARGHGLAVKLHAEQLSNLGGAALAAHHRALSADHLEYLDEDGVMAMAAAGTVAVLLPGAYFYLRAKRPPPIAALRKHQVPIAIASDHNPGTSPYSSLLLMLNMACSAFRLTPEEALAGVTRHAARALGMARSHGTLALGKAADAVLWDIAHPAELAYSYGTHRPAAIFRAGQVTKLH